MFCCSDDLGARCADDDGDDDDDDGDDGDGGSVSRLRLTPIDNDVLRGASVGLATLAVRPGGEGTHCVAPTQLSVCVDLVPVE